MCGIFGYTTIGKPNDKIYDIITKMFVETQRRGTHASGFAYFDHAGNLVVHKDPITSSEMVERKEWKELEYNLPQLLIGHCRYKTKGEPVDNLNNHPVWSKKFGWALVHNGVITNDDSVFKDFSLQRDGRVDTEAILKLFRHYMLKDVKTRPVDAIRKTYAKLEGSATCAFVGEEYPDTLFLCRNSNPLSMAYVPEWNTLFFASTDEILKDSLSNTEYALGGFFKKTEPIVKYYLKSKVEDDTLLIIHKSGGEFTIKDFEAKMKSPRLTYTIEKDKRGQGYFQDKHGIVHSNTELMTGGEWCD